MNRRLLTVAAAVSIAGGVSAWQFRDRWLPPGGFDATEPTLSGALRKCVQGSRVTYTDGHCPAGSREQAVRDDRVTVVTATPVPAPAAASSAGLPNARDVLGRPGDGSLRDKRMQQQIGE